MKAERDDCCRWSASMDQGIFLHPEGVKTPLPGQIAAQEAPAIWLFQLPVTG